MAHYTINESNNCLNTTNSHNVWNNCTFVEDRSELLTWLSPLEPGLRHSDIRENRVSNVGEWLMRTEEFRRWRGLDWEGENDKGVLFCYGDPGVGKTFISSLVVDRLCEQNTAVTCFYFDFAARKEQSAASMLGSLLKQMVSGMESIPDDISRALRGQKKGVSGSRPQLVEIVKLLAAITSSQPTFMCIDALDECTAVQRFKLFDSLKQILDKSPGTRIFVTGRPHIRAEIERRLPGRVTSVSVGPRKDDIVTYLRVRLSEDETPEAMDDMLEADILEKIPENISEMFLLVSLNIEAILQESTVSRRRQRLNKITDGRGLGDAYRATIERIKAQDGDKSRLGMEALMWISHAERPLRADELCHALAIELGSSDFDAGNIPSMSTLLGCCQGLITVDKEASTVRLIHFTLQEYLSAHPDLFSRPHSAIAELCLTYLNSEQVKAIVPDPSSDTPDPPFLKYCSLYWGAHAKRELSSNASSLALNLFQGLNGHISEKLLLEEVEYLYFGHFGPGFQFSGLHCASFFGIAKLVATLIEMRSHNINEGDFWGYTPLAWAARNGHAEVVKMLLRQEGVEPDKRGNYGKTPLTYAAEYGHEEVVKILVEEEAVDPDSPGNHGNTPLWFAARNGHEGVVEILLGREEVTPDRPNNDGQTPLSYAAWQGHEGVVKMLLERAEVNPDEPDNSLRTPLSYAAESGHEPVVRMLLGRQEVKPDNPSRSGQTPLSHAARMGREGVVEILLERREVKPDEPSNNGRTPLSYAAEFQHERVAKILLGRKEVSPDKPDDDGKTPLSYAAWRGCEGVVKTLLGQEEVDPQKPDNDGKTSLMKAISSGHAEVVALLQPREAVSHSAF